MSRPLLLLAAAFGLGSAVGGDVGARGAAVLLAFSALGLAPARSCGSPRGVAPASWPRPCGIGAAGAGVEVSAYERHPLGAWLARASDTGEPRPLQGIVFGDARDAADRFSLVLDAEGGAVPAGRVRIEIGGLAPRPEIVDGDRVRIFASLALPRGFHNPGAYDVVAAARHDGIVATGYCKSPRLVSVLGRGDVGLVRDLSARGRRAARQVLRRWILPGPEEGLVRAMVLGDRTGVERETAEAFRVAGTFHVLALSGRPGRAGGGVAGGRAPSGRASPAAMTAVVTALSVAFYAAFVGGDVPVVRAAVMTIVVVAGRALDLDADLANLLGLAALVLLAHRPSNVFDVGFQLSFGATLGLMLLTGPTSRPCSRGFPCASTRRSRARLAAQVALLPLLAGQFHRLTPAALVLNLIAVPLSGAVLLAGFGVLAVAWSPLLAQGAGDLAWIVRPRCSCVPASRPRGCRGSIHACATPSALAVGVYAMGVVSLLRGRSVGRSLGLLAAGLLWMVLPRSAVGDGRLRLTVLDVGQGDGLVLRSPRGRVRLVDAGGTYDSRFDVGEAVVGPYLWSQGMSSARRNPGHPRPSRPCRGRSRDRARLLGGRRLGGSSTATGSRVRRLGGAADRGAGSRADPWREGMSEVWDGVAIRVVGPVADGRGRGEPGTTIRSRSSWCSATSTCSSRGTSKPTGEARLDGGEGADRQGAPPRQPVEQQSRTS